MKKIFTAPVLVIAIMTVWFTSASAQTHTVTVHHTTIKKTVVVKTTRPSAATLAEGKALFTKSDCLTCHKLDTKLVGPAYYDVAKKYLPTQANYEMLANKVIAGGTGVWGQVPMAPHPQLAHADAVKIVEYILSLKAPK